MHEIKVTSGCAGTVPRGSIFFPKEGDYPSGRVIVKIKNKGYVLEADRRTDAGKGACLGGSLLSEAGDGKAIEYRQGRWFDVYWYDKKKLWSAVASVLALAASIALAAIAFKVDSASTDTATRTAAVVVLVLTLANLVLGFVKDLSS